MKILVISSGVLPLPPVKGGAVENLIDIILKANEKNNKYDLTVYSIYDEEAVKESLNYKNCKFKFVVGTTIKYKISKIWRGIINKIPYNYIGNAYINEIVKKENFNDYDYILIENSPEYAIPIAKKTNKKIILHLHNDRLNKKTKNAKKIVKLYTKIFALSNFVANKVKEIELLEENKVRTLYNGIDVNRFGKERYIDLIPESKSVFNIKQNDKVILYTGRIVPEKGVLEVIKAFEKVNNQKNVKLLITGSIHYKKNSNSNYLKKIKKIVKNNSNIIFTGYVDYEKMPLIYAISDIGVVPSIWEEPFALTVIEHMATGNPVLITDSGGMVELVNDNCAITVKRNINLVENLKIAIEDLIQNTEKRNYMGKMAKKQSKKFNQEKYVSEFEMLVKEIDANEN